ncbi:hypothetical protein G4B88_016335 [Cannabis sativa]|uniref:Uncharacterized protein n=1 Tax=Cannabis sativa TaxID=3483 RepID=A0A7J6GLX8_CANSA|nr:hypothetical protein G4B88_016335 [Cannabis sativa]
MERSMENLGLAGKFTRRYGEYLGLAAPTGSYVNLLNSKENNFGDSALTRSEISALAPSLNCVQIRNLEFKRWKWSFFLNSRGKAEGRRKNIFTNSVVSRIGLNARTSFFRIFWLVIAFSAPLLYYQIHKGPPLSHVEAHLSSSSCPYSIPYEVEKQHHQ